MKKLIFALVTMGLATLFALGMVEVYLRYQVLGSLSAVWTGAMMGDRPYANLSSGEWALSDPELGYRLNPAHEDINSLGIRGDELPLEKCDGIQRIVVLGDSVAWPQDGFVKLVGDKLDGRAEVINAAIPGYTTHQERILFDRELLKYAPDLVILQVCLNDNHHFLHRFDSRGGMIWSQEAKRALLPSAGDPLSLLPNWSYLVVRLRLTYTIMTTPRRRFPWDGALDFVTGWQDPGWELFREEFALLHESVKSIGGRVTVVIFPFAPQYRPDLLEENENYVMKPQRALKQICDEAGVPLLDMYPIIGDNGGRDLLPDRIHLSKEGHVITADALYQHLVDNELVAAPSTD
jgi:lysophospholipase L1-like esterase